MFVISKSAVYSEELLSESAADLGYVHSTDINVQGACATPAAKAALPLPFGEQALVRYQASLACTEQLPLIFDSWCVTGMPAGVSSALDPCNLKFSLHVPQSSRSRPQHLLLQLPENILNPPQTGSLQEQPSGSTRGRSPWAGKAGPHRAAAAVQHLVWKEGALRSPGRHFQRGPDVCGIARMQASCSTVQQAKPNTPDTDGLASIIGHFCVSVSCRVKHGLQCVVVH